jgi:hypothetical protein
MWMKFAIEIQDSLSCLLQKRLFDGDDSVRVTVRDDNENEDKWLPNNRNDEKKEAMLGILKGTLMTQWSSRREKSLEKLFH